MSDSGHRPIHPGHEPRQRVIAVDDLEKQVVQSGGEGDVGKAQGARLYHGEPKKAIFTYHPEGVGLAHANRLPPRKIMRRGFMHRVNAGKLTCKDTGWRREVGGAIQPGPVDPGKDASDADERNHAELESGEPGLMPNKQEGAAAERAVATVGAGCVRPDRENVVPRPDRAHRYLRGGAPEALKLRNFHSRLPLIARLLAAAWAGLCDRARLPWGRP